MCERALRARPAGAPTARIDFTVAAATHSQVWKDGTASAPERSAISVFDSSSAQVYFEEKTEVRFRPVGLDVIDRATSTCLRVKKVLDGEADALRSQPVRLPTIAASTEAGRLIASLTVLTNRKEVDRLGTLTEQEENEHDSLTAILSAAKGGRFAAEFAKELGLEGVGSAEWTGMWENAKSYSEGRAYPKHAFPHVADGAVPPVPASVISDAKVWRKARCASRPSL